VDHALAVVSDEYFAFLAPGGGAAFTPSNPLLRVSEGRVGIDAVASGDVHALQADLEALAVIMSKRWGGRQGYAVLDSSLAA